MDTLETKSTKSIRQDIRDMKQNQTVILDWRNIITKLLTYLRTEK